MLKKKVPLNLLMTFGRFFLYFYRFLDFIIMSRFVSSEIPSKIDPIKLVQIGLYVKTFSSASSFLYEERNINKPNIWSGIPRWITGYYLDNIPLYWVENR